MGKGRIRLISTVPGPVNLAPLVREFCRRDGVLTSFSDSAVKTLAQLAPDGSDLEAIPFGSLVRRFATLCGEMPLPVAHLGQVVAAISAACEDLPSDSPFVRTASRPGLHLALAETLHDLSEYGLGPEQMQGLAVDADDALGAKLRSMSHIQTEATEALRQLGRAFSRDHASVCMAGAPERGAELGRVLVLAGGDFHPQACEILKWAALHGAKVTVITYRHAGSAELFPEAKRTLAALGFVPQLTLVEGDASSPADRGTRTKAAISFEEAGIANSAMRHLFNASQADDAELKCEIVSTADPLAETEWALRGCLERHVAGVAYDGLAIYVRDLVSYAPLIESAAKRLGLPIRMWRRVALMTNSFARLTEAALAFCASRDVRSLRSVSDTSYFNLSQNDRESLHAALDEAHLMRAEQWQKLRNWTAEQQNFEWVGNLLDWRADALSNPAPVECWIARLRDLIGILPLQDDFPGGRERDKRAQFVLHQSLNHMASVHRLRGHRSLTLVEFLRAAREVWKEADVSLPAAEHGVLVASQSESLPDVRTLFVLGMLEGVFPRRRTEDPILTDFDREWISDHTRGPRLADSRTRATAERDEFYAICAAASEELIFSYPETGEDRDNVPAFYLEEVERALRSVKKSSRPRNEIVPELNACLASSDRHIREALDDRVRAEPASTAFSDPATSSLFASDPRQGLKPREFREALRCPFSAFVRRTLDIRPDRLRARWYSLVRLPQLGLLGDARTAADATRALDAALAQQLDAMYGDVPQWEIALLRAGGGRLVKEWVEREFTARELWPRDQYQSGIHFGEYGLRDTLPKGVKLRGTVPAVSRVGPYSVVHLQETSGPARGFGPAHDMPDDEKLYYGLHLLAAWDKNAPSALDIETMAGERVLMLLPRVPGVNLTGKVQQGLKVIDLGGSEDSGGPRAFFEDVKKLAQEAARTIESVDVRTVRGDHCTWCDYGELCRQSLEYGEEDSPFVEDL